MDKLNKAVEAFRPQMTDSVQRLVRIRSVEAPAEGENPFGNGVQACLQEALALCSELGFSTVNLDNHLAWCEVGQGKEMIAVLGHLDVVPEGEGWSHPPYAAEIADGRIYGRGTIDDKGPVVAALYALKALVETGVPLKRRIRLFFGLNEETGAADLKYYHSHGGEVPVMGFTPDGEFPLINGEKGILNETYEKEFQQTQQAGKFQLISIKGGVAANVAPDHAQALLRCPAGTVLPTAPNICFTQTDGGWLVEAKGVSAHGSHPETGENAIGRLALYLRQFPFCDAAKEALDFLAEKIGMDCFGTALGCALQDEISGPLSFNLGVIEGDETALRVKLNYRYPVTFEEADCQPAVQAAFEQAGWRLVQHVHKPKLYLPPSSPLVQKLLDVYRQATGDNAPPKSIGGGTYAKAMPNILAFGPIFPGDEVTEHKPDEYLEIDRMVQLAQILASAMCALAQ